MSEFYERLLRKLDELKFVSDDSLWLLTGIKPIIDEYVQERVVEGIKVYLENQIDSESS